MYIYQQMLNNGIVFLKDYTLMFILDGKEYFVGQANDKGNRVKSWENFLTTFNKDEKYKRVLVPIDHPAHIHYIKKFKFFNIVSNAGFYDETVGKTMWIFVYERILKK